MKFKVLLIVISLFVLFSCEEGKKEVKFSKSDNTFLTSEIIDLDSGYGYVIYKDGFMFIYQNLIPGINGRFVFKTREDARITADYIINKLSSTNGLPAVFFEELDSLGVLDSNVIRFQLIDFNTKDGVLPVINN